MKARLSKEKPMEDHRIDIDPQQPLTERRRGLAGLLQRLRASQQPPAPFRDSDFESLEMGVDWAGRPFDPRPGTAD